MSIFLSRYALVSYAALVLASGVLYYGHTQRVKGEAAGRAAEAAALRERDAAISALEASQKASKGYSDELEDLRNRPAVRQPVRLCIAPNLPVPGAAEGTDEASTPTGELPVQPGPDIGDRLRDEARRADELAAQLRALQGWIEQVSQ